MLYRVCCPFEKPKQEICDYEISYCFLSAFCSEQATFWCGSDCLDT